MNSAFFGFLGEFYWVQETLPTKQNKKKSLPPQKKTQNKNKTPKTKNLMGRHFGAYGMSEWARIFLYFMLRKPEPYSIRCIKYPSHSFHFPWQMTHALIFVERAFLLSGYTLIYFPLLFCVFEIRAHCVGLTDPKPNECIRLALNSQSLAWMNLSSSEMKGLCHYFWLVWLI